MTKKQLNRLIVRYGKANQACRLALILKDWVKLKDLDHEQIESMAAMMEEKI
jgi:hypothetical protein